MLPTTTIGFQFPWDSIKQVTPFGATLKLQKRAMDADIGTCVIHMLQKSWLRLFGPTIPIRRYTQYPFDDNLRHNIEYSLNPVREESAYDSLTSVSFQNNIFVESNQNFGYTYKCGIDA